jgi:hypothetical protein
MDANWSALLDGPAPAQHAVQVYRELDELTESVALYLAAGFDSDEPAVVIATPEHWDAFAARLESLGWHTAPLELSGQLTVKDARATLETFLVDGMPSPVAFEHVVGKLLDHTTERVPGRRIRAFGEMVDLLREDGNLDGAFALEALWNGLAVQRDFSLLCGYQVDVFDRTSQVSLLPEICRAHSHVHAADNPERLQRAVDRALEESLGKDTGKVYALLGSQIRGAKVPTAQLALMWVSENMPGSAERILAAARSHYLADA